MAWEFMTEDQKKAAIEAGYRPEKFRFPPIPEEIYLDYEKYGKATGCTAETAIVSALNAFMGKV